MSSTTRMPAAEVPEAEKAALLMNGELLDPVEVMWHNRPVLFGMFALGREAEKWNELDSDLKSFAAMAADALVGCSWCLDLGYFQAHNAGLDVAKASEVPRWRESAVFTAVERDVMEYSEAMSVTPPQVTDDLFARLLEQLGAPAMVELTAWIAFANMSARSNIAMGISSQGFSNDCPVPLAQPSAGGATPE
ncbi:MAG TPA: carboxymuconolactone decarboxylase family protein [Iamia sp.]